MKKKSIDQLFLGFEEEKPASGNKKIKELEKEKNLLMKPIVLPIKMEELKEVKEEKIPVKEDLIKKIEENKENQNTIISKLNVEKENLKKDLNKEQFVESIESIKNLNDKLKESEQKQNLLMKELDVKQKEIKKKEDVDPFEIYKNIFKRYEFKKMNENTLKICVKNLHKERKKMYVGFLTIKHSTNAIPILLYPKIKENRKISRKNFETLCYNQSLTLIIDLNKDLQGVQSCFVLIFTKFRSLITKFKYEYGEKRKKEKRLKKYHSFLNCAKIFKIEIEKN